MGKMWLIYRDTSLIAKITVALIIGVLVGLIFGQSANVLKPLGDLMMHLLKFLIIPLIVFTLIVGVNQSQPKDLGRMGVKVILYYIVTSAFALVIGLAVASLFNPGVGLTVPSSSNIKVPHSPSFINILVGIVPTNIFNAFANLDLLSIIFIALIFGFAIVALRQSTLEKNQRYAQLLLDFAEAGSEVSIKIMNWVLQYIPIGIFAIIAMTVGKQGLSSLESLGSLIGTVYSGLVIQLFIYSLLLFLFHYSPLTFFKLARDTMATAFVTQSSLGTLPVTLNSAKRLGLKEGLYGFSLPLGATINMDGAAVRIGASAIFAANAVGMHLSMGTIVTIVLTGTLASIGTAGVPGAGLITISAVLVQAGLPLEVVALIGSVDAILGMGCTALNVTGDLVGTTVINQTEKKQI